MERATHGRSDLRPSEILMATTNFVRFWRDGERLFVDVNGATIEARSVELDDRVVTLQFQGTVTALEREQRAFLSALRRVDAARSVP